MPYEQRDNDQVVVGPPGSIAATPAVSSPGGARIGIGIALLAVGSLFLLRAVGRVAVGAVPQDNPMYAAGTLIPSAAMVVVGVALLSVGRARRREALSVLAGSSGVQGPGPLPAPRRRMAMAAYVLAVAAFALGLIPLLGLLTWIPASVAIVLGAIALARRSLGRGFALAGVIVGSLAVQTGIAVSFSSVGDAATTVAARATADPAHERQYLDAALDAVSIGMGGERLVGDARDVAHEQADPQLLKAGYAVCVGFARGRTSAESTADDFLKGFEKSGGSEAQAKRVGKALIVAVAQNLCPDQLDEAKAVSASL